MKEIGFVKFLTGTLWRPKNEIFGIFPMIVGSLYVTAGAIIIGVPIGILTAVFMAYYCPERIYKPLKAATELLAGIPSVIYGFFGLVVIVPLVREFGRTMRFHGNGNSILTASCQLLSDLQSLRLEQSRNSIMKGQWHLELLTNALFSDLSSRQQNPE